MNGDFGFDIPIDESGAVDGGGTFGDFFETARARLGDIFTPVLPDQSAQSGTIGSQIFEAIYQYGRGRVDYAREKAVNSFLMTTEGQRIQREGIRQTAQQYAPLIIIAAIGLVLFSLFMGRR